MTHQPPASFVQRNRKPGDPRHGTTAGALRHAEAQEDPCDACRAAKAEYDRQWRGISENTMRNRLAAKAQAQANKALKDAHPDEYREAYIAAKVVLFAEHDLEMK